MNEFKNQITTHWMPKDQLKIIPKKQELGMCDIKNSVGKNL